MVDFFVVLYRLYSRDSGVAECWSILAVGKELSTFLMGVLLKRFGAYGRVTLTGL